MEVKMLGLFFGKFGVYGFELLNLDMENKERGLLCFTWSPRVAIWADILFIRIHIEL